MFDLFSIVVVLFLFALGLLFETLFLNKEEKTKVLMGTTLKGLGSLCFVLLGLYCLWKNSTTFGILLEIGLVLGLLGDVFLNLQNLHSGGKANQVFVVGVFAFLFGHLSYIAALVMENPGIVLLALGIDAFIALVAMPWIHKKTRTPSLAIKIIGAIYIPIVVGTFTFGFSHCILSGFSRLGVLFAIGSFLFMASDFILVYNSFIAESRPFFRKLNLYTYYVGQAAIALCIILV